MEPGSGKPESDDYTTETYNNYLNAQDIVTLTGDLSNGKVLKRKLDRDSSG